MGMRLAGALALVLSVVTFAGPAFAGNGNGNGNGGGNGSNSKPDSGSAAVSPGNSAGAPGQLKKDEAVASDATSTTTPAAVVPAGSSSVSGQGVKPGNDTSHDTHAAASSTKTKLYGNGHTAGEIAIRNGAAPSSVLHGPGNSQPHKAALCSGRHEVDVHALKSKRHRDGCGSVSDPKGPGGGGKDEKGSDPGNSSSPGAAPASRPATQTAATSPKPKGNSKVTSRETGAVLATVQRPAGATLPFTGFPLWIGVALGVVLLGLGLALALVAGRETEREAGP